MSKRHSGQQRHYLPVPEHFLSPSYRLRLKSSLAARSEGGSYDMATDRIFYRPDLALRQGVHLEDEVVLSMQGRD